MFCNYSSQQIFFFNWNAINVRILNSGQIEIEGGWGEEETLTLRGQARSQCESEKNVKKKKDKIKADLHQPIYIFVFYSRMDFFLSISVARNLGSWFDRHLDISFHISEQCASAFYHLHNISRIRRFLSTDTTKALVHAFVTSRVDYCDSLFYYT